MRKKLFRVSILLLLAISSLIGCDRNGLQEDLQNDTNEETVIIKEMKLLSDAIDSKDANRVYDMLSDDLKNDTVLDALETFENDFSGAKNIYVNSKTCWIEKGDYRTFSMVSGIIVTNDNIYTLKFDFNEENNKLTKLWIITGETESTENLSWDDGYRFDNSEKFVYANYYDKGVHDYRLIWGMVVKWDDNAVMLEKEDVMNMIDSNTSIDDIVAKYGPYGADVKEAEHFYCYPTKTDGEYVQIFVDSNGTVIKVETTDAIDYGIMGLKEVR